MNCIKNVFQMKNINCKCQAVEIDFPILSICVVPEGVVGTYELGVKNRMLIGCVLINRRSALGHHIEHQGDDG